MNYCEEINCICQTQQKELRATIRTCDLITPEQCQRLIASMQPHIAAVIQLHIHAAHANDFYVHTFQWPTFLEILFCIRYFMFLIYLIWVFLLVVLTLLRKKRKAEHQRYSTND